MCTFFSLNRSRPNLKILQTFQCFELNLPIYAKMNSFWPRPTEKLCLQNSRSYLDLNPVLIRTSFGAMRLFPLAAITWARLNLTVRGKSNCVLLLIYSRRFCTCNERQCENVSEPGATCSLHSLNLLFFFPCVLHKLESVLIASESESNTLANALVQWEVFLV